MASPPPRSSNTGAAIPAFAVVSDLDGTLLDHHSYYWRAAKPALSALRERGIPVIAATSKTPAEIAEWQREIGLDAAFIAENGGVVARRQADGRLQRMIPGPPYQDLRALLKRLRAAEGFRFRGFGDMSEQLVAEACGMSVERARLARQRQATEPLLWDDAPDRIEAFRTRLQEAGLALQRGGRFWHVTAPVSKADALKELWPNFPSRPIVIALGDSPNDLDLLQAAHHGVLVQRPGGDYCDAPSGLYRADGIGPVGWNRAVLELLEKLPAVDPVQPGTL